MVWNRLIGLVDEAALSLARTAYSAHVREGGDYAVALLTPRGEALAYCSVGTPTFFDILPHAARDFLKVFPKRSWRPGDMAITNDPWLGSGHLPDVVSLRPLFHDGELVAFAGIISHLPDIGGSAWTPDTTDLFQEGLCIGPSRLFRGGRPNNDLMDIIRRNVRVPDHVIADLYAHVAAGSVASARLMELLADEDLTSLETLAAQILDRSERAVLRAIAGVPDGVYQNQLTTDTTLPGSNGPQAITLSATIKVEGERMRVDYAGSSAQVPLAINSVLNHTRAHTLLALKCLLDPATPCNDGSFRAIEVDAPSGSVLNPRPPAAVNSRHLCSHYLHALLFGALEPAIPDRVIADCGAPSIRAQFHGTSAHGPFVITFIANGGMGGRSTSDGPSCMGFPSNAGGTSTEVIESLSPLLIETKELEPDSGGSGRYRGGCGQRIVLSLHQSQSATVLLHLERTGARARGRIGGQPGGRASAYLASGRPLNLRGRNQLDPGDHLVLVCPGGGGYGPAGERDSALAAGDLIDGYISTNGLEPAER